MELFYTNIRLKEEVNKEQIKSIIFEWITNSPHYDIAKIDYSDESYFTQNFSFGSVSILSIFHDNNHVFSVRLINKEEKNTWITDCIYRESNDQKYISVTLNCHAKDYSSILPKIHKPYIIKKLFDAQICNQSNYFPICDYPIILKDEDLQICADIMNNKISSDLPITYISFDSFNSSSYSVNINDLAIKLSGISHVLVEPNKDFALKLKEISNGNNAYNGYIGIYFPKSSHNEIISFVPFITDGKLDKNKLAYFIRKNIQQALVNNVSSTNFSWNALLVEYNKDLIVSAKKESTTAQKDLEEYIKSFDEDIKNKEEKIRELQHELDKKDAMIFGFQKKYGLQNTFSFNKSSITEFYSDELHDLIINILSQVVEKNINPDSRSYELLNKFIEDNVISGIGEEIHNNIEKILAEKSLKMRRNSLEKLGFTVDIGAHDKIYFHDPKYSFTLSNTPGDYRTNENTAKEIIKKISVYNKYI